MCIYVICLIVYAHVYSRLKITRYKVTYDVCCIKQVLGTEFQSFARAEETLTTEPSHNQTRIS